MALWGKCRESRYATFFLLVLQGIHCFGWNTNDSPNIFVKEHEARGRRIILVDGSAVFVRDEGFDSSDPNQKTIVMIH